MLCVQVDAFNEIINSITDWNGIGAVGRFASQCRIQGRSRHPRFKPAGSGISVPRNETEFQDQVTGNDRGSNRC